MKLTVAPFPSSKKILEVSFLLVSCIIFYLFQFASPSWIESYYTHNKFEVLNLLARATGQKSLTFYLGEVEEKFFGPLSQLISGLMFVYLALRYLVNSPIKIFTLSVFVYLVSTKLQSLTFPPYGDAIGGPFAEALWLAQHNFDYIGLYHEAGYAAGGPKVYMFSLYPTFLAVMLKAISSTKIFLIVSHVIVFGMSAFIVATLREIFSRQFNKDSALLCSLLLLFLGTFQSQVEAINMEIPCLLFVILSAKYLLEKKFYLSGLMAMLAVGIKGTAVFAAMGFVSIIAVLFLMKPQLPANKKILLYSLGVLIFALLQVASKFLMNDQHVSAGMVMPFKGWPSFKVLILPKVFLFFLIVIGFFYLKEIFSNRKKSKPQISLSYDTVVMLTFAVMWFLLFLNFLAVSPRYTILVFPFIIFTIFYALQLIIREYLFQRIALLLAICVVLFSSYGFFYPPLGGNDHVLLERSLEYRNDLKLNKHLSSLVEEKFSGYHIAAPFIMAQILAIPQLGYVTKNLDVMIYGFQCHYGGIKNYPSPTKIDVLKTIYVGVPIIDKQFDVPYPVHPNDKIIQELEWGRNKAWLFMGGHSINFLKIKELLYLLKKRELQHKTE